jgi:hypothetical protein
MSDSDISAEEMADLIKRAAATGRTLEEMIAVFRRLTSPGWPPPPGWKPPAGKGEE